MTNDDLIARLESIAREPTVGMAQRRVQDACREAAAALREAQEERADWARRFMLDGRTPWEWENLCKRAEAERDALRKLLVKYGRHRNDAKMMCDALNHHEYPCNCGWDAALAKGEGC